MAYKKEENQMFVAYEMLLQTLDNIGIGNTHLECMENLYKSAGLMEFWESGKHEFSDKLFKFINAIDVIVYLTKDTIMCPETVNALAKSLELSADDNMYIANLATLPRGAMLSQFPAMNYIYALRFGEVMEARLSEQDEKKIHAFINALHEEIHASLEG